MDERQRQEETIRNNLSKLIKSTKNLSKLLNKLLQYEVLSGEDVKQLTLCSDEGTAIHLLYEMVISRLPSSFDLLIFALRDTDNERVGALMESEVKKGYDEEEHSYIDSIKHRLLRRRSSCDQYKMNETRALNISGGEMGIAEIIEDYEEYSNDSFKRLTKTLKLSDADRRLVNHIQNNFVHGATILLRKWVEQMGPQKSNVVMLTKLFDNDGQFECAERIRSMFDNFVDSGYGLDFPGNFTRKEEKIAAVLNVNPSFSLYPERLFFLLDLPLEEMADFIQENRFVPSAMKMLTAWCRYSPTESNGLEKLSGKLAMNGHFCTAEKLAHL